MPTLRALSPTAALRAFVSIWLIGCASAPSRRDATTLPGCDISPDSRSLETSLHGDFRIAISDSASLPGRHPILIHLEPVAASSAVLNDSSPAQFDVRLPIVGSIIGDSLVSLNRKSGHPTVAVGKRGGSVIIVVDPLNRYIGPAFELTVTEAGTSGFTGTWLRTRSGSMTYNLDQAFDMGPFCAKRLNPDLDPDAPSVYRAAIDSLFAGSQSDMPIILAASLLSDSSGELHRFLPAGAEGATIRSFTSRQLSGAKRLDAIGLDWPTVILSDSAERALTRRGLPLVDSALTWRPMQEAGPFWLALRLQYFARGVTQLSDVGFNAAHTQAILEVVHRCGTDCYSSEIDLLSKQRGTWSVEERRLIPSRSREGNHFGTFFYIGPNKRPDNPPEVYAKDPSAALLRRVMVRITDSATHMPLVGYEVRAVSPFQPYAKRETTNESGDAVFTQTPFGQLPLMVHCPRIAHRQGRELLTYERRPEPFVRPAIDTLVAISVDSRICMEEPGFVRLDTTAASSGRELRDGYPTGDAADVYRAAFRAVLSDSVRGDLFLLAATTTHACSDASNCGSLQLFRLDREGQLNATTVRAFKREAAQRSPVDPRFWRDGRAAVITDLQLKRLDSLALRYADLDERGNSIPLLWAEFEHAFPGAHERFSATRVGFSSDGREALVEISRDTLADENTSELMLLRRTGSGWSVTRRHIERETTTGVIKNGSCEPATPSTSPPPLADLKTLRGVYELTTVSTHPDWPGTRYKTILSLWGKESAVDRRDFKMDGLAYSPTDKKRSPKGADAARFSGKPGAVALTIGPQSMCFDCGVSEYWVLNKISDAFFGSWEPIYGLGYPQNRLGEITRDGGYFCAKRVGAGPFERFPTPTAQRQLLRKAAKAALPLNPVISYIDSGQRRVIVQVTDTMGRPLEGAVVQLTSDSSSSTVAHPAKGTDRTGITSFSNVVERTYVLTARRLGYAKVIVPIKIGPHTTKITVRLFIPWEPCEFCVIVPSKH